MGTKKLDLSTTCQPHSYSDQDKMMEYVEICNQRSECKNFSRLVMGTDHLIQAQWTHEEQSEIAESKAFEILDEAGKHGINFFDTSPIYVGNIENKIGKWKNSRSQLFLKDSFYNDPNLNPDRTVYILSKGGFPFDLYWSQQLPPGSHSLELKNELKKNGILHSEEDLSTEKSVPLHQAPPGTYASRLFGSQSQITQRVAEEMKHTLANLNGDISIYLMHRDDGDAFKFRALERPKTPVKTILQALAGPSISHQFWMMGWSNWKTDRITESLQLTDSHQNLPRPVINSPYFSLFEMSDRTIHALGVQVTHEEMMNLKFQEGIKIMPYSPLGGFSILDKPEPKWENAKKAAREKFLNNDPYWQNVYISLFTEANEARWNRVNEFTKVFNQKNCTDYTVDQILNAYVLAHPRTDLLAIGPITKEQIRRTVLALKISKQLKIEDLNYLYYGH